MFSVEGGHYVEIQINLIQIIRMPYNSTAATLSNFTYIPDRSYALMGMLKTK